MRADTLRSQHSTLDEGRAEEGARAANEILSDYKAGIFP
jgi:hypothetical protein